VKNRVLAWFNLAYRFNRHVLTRVPMRTLRPGADFERFAGAVGKEGYLPLTPAERALLPATMRCVHCGLCSFAARASGPDEARATAPPRYSAWDEPWTFVAGPSRSIDRAALVDAHPPIAAGPANAVAPADAAPPPADAADALCPAGVPITAIATLHHRLARAESPGAP
jgi:hypothetical protein